MRPLNREEILQVFRFQDTWTGLACTGNARVVLEICRDNGFLGRCYWADDPSDDPEDASGHAYIALNDQGDDELPLNISRLFRHTTPTVGVLRNKGTDITDEIMSLPLSYLR